MWLIVVYQFPLLIPLIIIGFFAELYWMLLVDYSINQLIRCCLSRRFYYRYQIQCFILLPNFINKLGNRCINLSLIFGLNRLLLIINYECYWFQINVVISTITLYILYLVHRIKYVSFKVISLLKHYWVWAYLSRFTIIIFPKTKNLHTDWEVLQALFLLILACIN